MGHQLCKIYSYCIDRSPDHAIHWLEFDPVRLLQSISRIHQLPSYIDTHLNGLPYHILAMFIQQCSRNKRNNECDGPM